MLVGERPGLRAGGVWNETCVFCHNTVPYFDDVWGELRRDPGAPAYQGEVVDSLLPPSRRLRPSRSRAATRWSDAVAAEVTRHRRNAAVAAAPTGAARGAQARDPRAARRASARAHFVEVGIGCEACHGGSRQHVDDPRVLPDFAPRSAFLEARPAARPTAR